MSKTISEKEEEVILDVQEAYSKTEAFVENNKKQISMTIGVVIAVVGMFLSYKYLYIAPKEVEAQEMIWRAELYFEKDSFRLALEGDNANPGFLEIAGDYGMTKSGNLANYYAGLCYLRMGQFEEAITFLEDFSSDDEMLSAVSVGAIGDAWMELENKGEAISHYEKAATISDNDFTTPIYLMKAGKLLETTGDYAAAAEHYNRIKEAFPTTNEGRSIEKYLARANAMSQK